MAHTDLQLAASSGLVSHHRAFAVICMGLTSMFGDVFYGNCQASKSS